MLDQGLVGDDSAATHVERYFLEAGREAEFHATGELFTGPVVVPGARREFETQAVGHLVQFGRYQKILPEQKLFPVSVEALLLGVLQEERAHKRNTGPAGFLETGIDVREQPVAQLDVPFANGLVVGPMHPGLLISAALHGVVAKHRREGAQLCPARQEVGRRAASEAADVGAHEGIARQPQPQKAGHHDAIVIPGAGVVSGPGGRVPLAAGKGRAGQNKGAPVRPQALQTLVGGAHHLHAEDVVHFTVIRAAEVGAVDGIERHRLVRPLEDGRLVHIVPDGIDSLAN